MWCIGDGKSIDAWKDIWIDVGIVLDQIVEIPQHLHGKKLWDLVDVEGHWDWTLFQSWLPADIIKK
jgi:hypothetical protein